MRHVRQLVTFVTRYRSPFHERARQLLLSENINYEVICGEPTKIEASKSDFAHLSWAKIIHNRHITLKGLTAVWQPAWSLMRGCDLAIVSQENRLLINYPLQIWRSGNRLALWGHGRNFQSRKAHGIQERWKRFWATRCDWWFGYTEETRQLLLSYGFSHDRITIFNNSVDTTALRQYINEVSLDQLRVRRESVGLKGKSVGVFVGGLHKQKRLPFLIESAKLIKRSIPTFELIIIGGGPEYDSLKSDAADYPWIKIVGPKFGREKVELMMLGRVFLMPGLVGLAILDSGAVGLPIVTTRFPFHSPEISYLQNGQNGIIVEDWQNPAAYARAVSELLCDEHRLTQMSLRAAQIAQEYTIEKMANRFSEGVIMALRAPRRC